MSSKQELLEEVLSLPVEDRAYFIDSLIKSLNATDSEIDRAWIDISRKRWNELKSGKVQGISGEEVFEKIWKRFDK